MTSTVSDEAVAVDQHDHEDRDRHEPLTLARVGPCRHGRMHILCMRRTTATNEAGFDCQRGRSQ